MFILISWNPNLFAGAIGYITHATWSTILTQSRPSKRGRETNTNSAQGFGRGEIGPRVSQPFLVADCCLKSSTWKSGLRYYDSSTHEDFFQPQKSTVRKTISSKKNVCFPWIWNSNRLNFDSNPPYVNHPWKPPMKIKKNNFQLSASLQNQKSMAPFSEKTSG